MLGPVVAWVDAAVDALTVALPDVVVFDGPLVNTDDNIGGADLVIVGHDDDDERGTAGRFEGGWHGIGFNAPQSGDATVYVSIESRSGEPVTMRARRAAALALYQQVAAVLFPNPNASSLGDTGVAWAAQSGWAWHQLPTDAGPVATIVLAVHLKITPA